MLCLVLRALLDLVNVVRPVAFEDRYPVVHRLQALGVKPVHAMLSAFDHRDHACLSKRTEVLGDGRLGDFHAKDDLVYGVFLPVREHGDDLTPPRLCDGCEDIRRMRLSGHAANIFLYRNMSSAGAV